MSTTSDPFWEGFVEDVVEENSTNNPTPARIPYAQLTSYEQEQRLQSPYHQLTLYQKKN